MPLHLTRARRGALATGLGALLAFAPLAPLTAHAVSSPEGAAFEVTFPDGTKVSETAVPEYSAGMSGDLYVSIVVRNTGDKDLILRGVSVPDGGARDSNCTMFLPVGESITCQVRQNPGTHAPGTVTEVPITVTGVAGEQTADDPWGGPVPGATWMTDSVTLVETAYDVQPQVVHWGASASPTTVAAGEPITYMFGAFRSPYDGPNTHLAAMTSTQFGNILDPNNPLVRDNTCLTLGTAYPSSCSFTVDAPSGVTSLEDTLTTELSDGTGSNLVLTQPISVTIAGATTPTPEPTPTTPVYVPSDAATWAKSTTLWPSVQVDGKTLTRLTPTSSVLPLGKCASTIPASLGSLLEKPVPARGKCVNEWRLAKATVVTLLNEAADAAYPAPAQEQVLADTAKALTNGKKSLQLAQRYESWIPQA